MKYLLVLLAIMPLALGVEELEDVDRSLSSLIVNAIEDAKKQMPCGFPGLGVPPLAPLKTRYHKVNIDFANLKAVGEVYNFRMDGLDDFDIIQLKVSPVTSRLSFKFNWNHVYLNTDYKMSANVNDVDIRGSGDAKFSIKDLKTWGVVKYSLGVTSGRLSLKELTLYMSLGEVKSEINGLSNIPIINNKLNEVIEQWLMLAINDNTENMPLLSNNIIRPQVNELIADMAVSDIIGLIGGEGGEKVPCVPPKDE